MTEPTTPQSGEDAHSTPFFGSRFDRLAGYDRSWAELLDGIVVARDRGADMAGLITAYHEAVAEQLDGVLPCNTKSMVAAIDLSRFAECAPPLRLVVQDGRYSMHPGPLGAGPVLDTVLGFVDQDTDCIVEFGSGLGFNLARLRLRLGDRPITYIACEPSAAGRQAAEVIFSLPPGGTLESHAFDYVTPNLDCLARFRKIVAFSSHSVEQVMVMGRDFYECLLGTNVVACVHSEPVGWQRFTNVHSMVLAIQHDAATRRHYRTNYVFSAEDDRLVENSAVWAGLMGYNTDLLGIVSDHAEAGHITLRALAYEISGANPFNPATLIAWTR